MSIIPPRKSITVVAPTPTPFNEDDSPSYELLAENVQKWLGTGLSGFVVGSYGGEEFHLSSEEKIQTIRTVAEAHKGQRFVIAGIDTPSPTVALDLAEKYASVGADMVRVRIPNIPKDGRQENGIVSYFDKLVNKSSIPVIIIHQPKQPMSVDATPEEVGQISSMDNVYAYIISLNYRWETQIPSYLHESTQLWTCNGSLLLPGAMIGAEGACLFFANWAPDLCREVIKLTREGDIEEANEIQRRLISSDFIGMDKGVAALKAGLNLLGYRATVPRRPTRALTRLEIAELENAFKEAGML